MTVKILHGTYTTIREQAHDLLISSIESLQAHCYLKRLQLCLRTFAVLLEKSFDHADRTIPVVTAKPEEDAS